MCSIICPWIPIGNWRQLILWVCVCVCLHVYLWLSTCRYLYTEDYAHAHTHIRTSDREREREGGRERDTNVFTYPHIYISTYLSTYLSIHLSCVLSILSALSILSILLIYYTHSIDLTLFWILSISVSLSRIHLVYQSINPPIPLSTHPSIHLSSIGSSLFIYLCAHVDICICRDGRRFLTPAQP